MITARAESIYGAVDNFSVFTGDGEAISASRAILSYGVVDEMPDVPGEAQPTTPTPG